MYSEPILPLSRMPVNCLLTSHNYNSCITAMHERTLMLDNVQVAILTKVNELAARFGINAYEFVAAINNKSGQFTILKYEVPVSGEPAKVARFDRMLDLMGIGDSSHELKGTNEEIIQALDNALRLAPKQRPRL